MRDLALERQILTDLSLEISYFIDLNADGSIRMWQDPSLSQDNDFSYSDSGEALKDWAWLLRIHQQEFGMWENALAYIQTVLNGPIVS